jgi:hypothetical protein
MKFVESKILTLYSKHQWAEFRWNDDKKVWYYERASEGFLKKYTIPHEFTEQQRLMLQIQLSEQ